MATNHTSERDPFAQPEWDGHPHRLFAKLEARPQLKQLFLELCSALMELMPPREREIVALRASAELDAEYPFHGHVSVASRHDILSIAEIAAVAAGDRDAFELADAVVMQGVDELLRVGRLSPATELALGREAFVDLTLAVGAYQTIARLMAGVGPEPGVADVAGLDTPAEARATHAAARGARPADDEREAA